MIHSKNHPFHRLLFYRFRFELILFSLSPSLAFADFASSIQSLVTGVIGGILPAFTMYEVALAGFAFVRKDPDAKRRAEITAVGAVAVLGVNGLWLYLKGHIR